MATRDFSLQHALKQGIAVQSTSASEIVCLQDKKVKLFIWERHPPAAVFREVAQLDIHRLHRVWSLRDEDTKGRQAYPYIGGAMLSPLHGSSPSHGKQLPIATLRNEARDAFYTAGVYPNKVSALLDDAQDIFSNIRRHIHRMRCRVHLAVNIEGGSPSFHTDQDFARFLAAYQSGTVFTFNRKRMGQKVRPDLPDVFSGQPGSVYFFKGNNTVKALEKNPEPRHKGMVHAGPHVKLPEQSRFYLIGNLNRFGHS